MARFFSAHDIVSAAVEVERRGRSVYTRAADASDNPEVKRLLEFLASEESRHETLFTKMAERLAKSELPAGSNASEYNDYLQALLDSHAMFSGDIAVTGNAIEMIELAIRFEKDTILFFWEMTDLVPPHEQGAVRACLLEEQSHVRQLGALLETLRKSA